MGKRPASLNPPIPPVLPLALAAAAALAALLLMPSAAGAQHTGTGIVHTYSTVEGATNRIGGDIGSLGIPGSDGGETVCASECFWTRGCVAWTYVKRGYPTAELAARCWLKAPAPPKTAGMPCCVSGVITAPKPPEPLRAPSFQ